MDIDGVTSNPRHSDVNPYDLAEDGAPGKTRGSTGDYSHVKQPGPRTTTTTTTTTSVMMSEESVEGDYSVVDVDDSYSLAKIVVTDDYSVVSHHLCYFSSERECLTVISYNIAIRILQYADSVFNKFFHFDENGLFYHVLPVSKILSL